MSPSKTRRSTRTRRQTAAASAAGASPVPSIRHASATPSLAPSRFPLRACTALILALTVVAYVPVLSGEFLQWDDQRYVEQSPVIHDAGGLRRIWNPAARATDQYYPLTFSSYWLEYRIWGLDARGYHAVNVLLHLVNTVLVTVLAGALGAAPPLQAAVAGVFALHPAQVASVAWIAERKNTLSAVFYLVAFLLYLRHRRSAHLLPYLGCLAAFAAALLSKTQTVTLPLVLLAADWCLQRTRRLSQLSPGRLAARLAPMLVLGVLAGVITMQAEQRPWTRTFTLAEQVVIAAHSALFYVRTFLLPIRLSPVYPEWQVSAGDPVVWLPVAGWAAVLAIGSAWHRRIPPLAACGTAQFFIPLAPVLGFIPFNLQTYTFIADHFLYLPTIGGGLVLAVLVERAVARLPRPNWQRAALTVMAGVLLAGAALQTAREAQHWRTNETFWLRVHERDPEGFLAIYNLGNHYRRLQRWTEALPYYRRAAEIRPLADYPFQRWLEALRQVEGERAAIAASSRRLAAQPNFFPAYLERATSYEALGEHAQAAADYARAVRASPPGSPAWAAARRGHARLRAYAPSQP
jgi:hypothetical protein